MKLDIGIILAHGFPVPAQFFISYNRLQQIMLMGLGNRLLPKGMEIEGCNVIFSQDFPTDVGRNVICRKFLDNDPDAQYLLFLDADMVHPETMPHQLVRHGEDIVTARYVVRKPPFFTVAMRKVGEGPHMYQSIDKLLPQSEIHGLMPIDAAGAGALLISRRVLAAIRAKFGDNWFQYQLNEEGLRGVSEDMWFFEKARECGFQAYLDADCSCKHIAQFEVDHEYHKPYADRFLNMREKEEVSA